MALVDSRSSIDSVNNVSSFNIGASSPKISMMTAQSSIVTQNGEHHSVNILLDCGSQRTFLLQRTAQKLNLKPVGSENLSLSIFGCTAEVEMKFDVVRVLVRCIDGSVVDLYPLVAPTICNSIQYFGLDLNQYPQFKSLEFSHEVELEQVFDIDILIGLDCIFNRVLTGQIVRTSDYGPCAIGSRLGYMVCGPVNSYSVGNNKLTTNFVMSNILDSVIDHEDLNKEIANLWRMEAIGITHPQDEPKKTFELDEYCDTIEFVNNRYVVSWPFKPYHRELPDNFRYSYRRTKSIVKKLAKSNMLDECDKIVKKQLEMGLIEK